MDDKQFQEISSKMDLVVRLLALNIVKDMENQNKQIMTLTTFGFKPSEIAKLLGTTSNTVSVALSRARRREKIKEKKA